MDSDAAAPVVLMWMSGPDAGRTWLSSAWCRFTGRAPEEESGDGWMSGLHPDDVGDCVAALREACAAREPVTLPYRLRRHDGAYHRLLDRAESRFAPDGAFLGHVGSCVELRDDDVAAHHVELLQRLSADLTRRLTRTEVTDVVVRHMAGALGAYGGGVAELTADETEFVLLGTVGYPDDVQHRYARFAVDIPAPVRDVVRTRAPVYLESYAELVSQYGLQPDIAHAGVTAGAWAALPLLVDDRLLGAITLSFHDSRSFTPDTRRFTRAFADLCAQALERVRLFEAEHAARVASERAARQISALQAVTAALSSAYTEEAVANVVMVRGLEAVDAERGSVALVSIGGDRIEVIASVGYPSAVWSRLASLPLDASYPLTDAIRTGTPVLLSSGEERRARYPHLAEIQTLTGNQGAIAALPMRSGERIIGALGVNWATNRAFDRDERAFLEALCHQSAQALERARLFEYEQRARRASELRLRYAERLQRATAELARALSPQEVAEAVLREATAAVDAPYGSVSVIDADGDTARLVAAKGWPEELLGRGYSLSRDGSPSRDVAGTGEAILIANTAEWVARYPAASPLMEQVGIVATVALPVAFDGRVQGVIGLSWQEAHEPSAEEWALMHALAAQCAQALERARLFEAERVARQAATAAHSRAEFLADASRLLSSSHEYETTLEQLAHAAVPRLADWCAVDLLADPSATVWPPVLERLIVRHSDPAKTALVHEIRARVPIHWDAPGGLPRALRAGATQLYPQITDEMLVALTATPETLALARELQLRSFLCVPLVSRGRTLGALTLCMAESGRVYTDEDRALAEALAQRAATAVEKSRLLRDTERSRAEAERAREDADQLRLDAERARSEAEEARRTAEAANLAKAEFLTVMSHELRTPLNAIGGYAELIELGIRGPVTPEQHKDLERIQRSQRHLLGMINEVLNYARLESGTVQYDIKAIRMADVLSAVEPLVYPQAQQRGLALSFDAGAEGLSALADGDKLQQILLNLLSNAIKFTRAGSVTVECSRRDEGGTPSEGTASDGRRLVQVRVRDTGMGIAADQLDRVFEPFVQLGRARHAPGEGAGLGLAISRDLARGMGGELVAESRAGSGSTFTLILPAA